eukprot:gene6312-7564_t
MPTIEELDSDEEEAPPPKKEAPEFSNFNDLLSKAAELKTAQLKETRRAWEAAPEWMKNTLNDGNASFKEGKYEAAVKHYVKGIGAFRYFLRQDKGEHIRLMLEDEELEEEERIPAQDLLATCYVNIAQCVLKVILKVQDHALRCMTTLKGAACPGGDNKSKSAMYACEQALIINPNNPKALYRNALAQLDYEDSTTSLEKAVKDLTKAKMYAAGAPPGALSTSHRDPFLVGFITRALEEDPAIKRAHLQYRWQICIDNVPFVLNVPFLLLKILKEQKSKDAGTFGGMFGRGELYTKRDQQRILEDRTEWMVGSDQAGIDLDDPQTRQELEQHAKKRREQEMQDKAKEMGIDLNDPEVQKALDMFAKEKEAADQLGQLPPISKWRRYLVRAIDPDKMFNVQRVVYVLIAINVGFRIYNTMQQNLYEIDAFIFQANVDANGQETFAQSNAYRYLDEKRLLLQGAT